MAKWAARPQILFSDSVPAARVDVSSVVIVADIVTLAAQEEGHAETEQILTDGCGLMCERHGDLSDSSADLDALYS